MLLVFGLLLTLLTGLSVLNKISPDFSGSERTGLSFLLGTGAVTLLMALMDLAGIPFTALSVSCAATLLILLLNIPLPRQPKRLLHRPKFRLPAVNLVWLLLFGLIVYLEGMNLIRGLYFPAFDRDSLSGFDTIGYLIGQEHTLKGLSIFRGDYMPSIHSAGSYITYAPMVQLSYGWVYLLGAESSKLIPSLTLLFFLIAFYGSLRRITGPTAAITATFFVLITPEMISFSLFSITNVIHAAYASLGVIYTTLWLRQRQRRDLLLAAVLLGLNVWCRTDGIVFTGAAICVLGIDALRKKTGKPLLLFTAVSLLPLLFWELFKYLTGLYAEGIVTPYLFFDAEKIGKIWGQMSWYIFSIVPYGIGFALFAAATLLNLKNIVRSGDNLPLAGMIVLALLSYMILLYQIDYKWDLIENVLAYSAKRFMFCFIAPVWFYIFTTRTVLGWSERLERFLAFPPRSEG